MGFTPTYDDLDERQPWENKFYNTLIDDLQTFANALTGADFAAPLVLSKSGQDLDGGDHYVYGFKRWFGHGTNISVRDVTAFGATGGGAVSDLAAIQATIDDLPTSGGAVFFPPGTYLVSGAINMRGTGGTRNNVTLYGFGKATVLKLANAANASVIEVSTTGTATGMLIQDLRITSNSANQTSTVAGISCTNANDVTIENVWIDDVKGDGILLDGADRVRVHGARVTDCTRHGIAHGSSGGQGTYVTIEGCHIESNDATGLDFEYPPLYLIVCGNQVFDNVQHGIQCYFNTGTSFEEVLIANNILQNNGSAGGTAFDGITVVHAGGVTCRNVVISGNVLNSGDRDGIVLEGNATSHIRGFSITGNTIVGQIFKGIRVGANVKYGTITGNVVMNSNSYGLDVNGTSGNTAAYLSITGNCFADDRAGLASQDYGIVLGAFADSCVAIGNTLYGNVTAQLLDQGTNNDIAHNPGF